MEKTINTQNKFDKWPANIQIQLLLFPKMK